ncbi:hypothetical protein AOLI_G00277610 [Acnodon oligacanthus]
MDMYFLQINQLECEITALKVRERSAGQTGEKKKRFGWKHKYVWHEIPLLGNLFQILIITFGIYTGHLGSLTKRPSGFEALFFNHQVSC